MIMNLLAVGLFMWIIELTTIQSSANVTCKDGDVQLTGGRHYREGRVEVCRNQQWGRVCDDYWDVTDAAVVCRQLGLSEAASGATVKSNGFGGSEIPVFLDDLGCNGSETSLLHCLPQHNCFASVTNQENAGVHCLRKGVTLEHGPNQKHNNTIITVNDIGAGESALFCSTDRELCCTDDLISFADHAESWFLPNGSKVPTDRDDTQSLFMTFGNQTVGLNVMNTSNDLELPTGIYHCEMTDKENLIHYLYVGIYPRNEGNIINISINYDKSCQTIMCTSTGGPATDVTWFKDNEKIDMISNGSLYNHLQIIINKTSATYENRLEICDKSSKAAGTYMCKVSNPRGSTNESLYIQVCRNMEVRVNKNNVYGRLIEVCIDDQWHEAISNTIVAINSQSPSDISVQVDSTSTSESVMIVWSEQSIPNDKTISGYDISCTTSALSDGQIHEVKVPNISTSTTKFQVQGLLPGTAYECCVSAHIQTSTPLDLISSNCATTTTKSDEVLGSGDLAVGLGTGLGLLLVVVCVGLIFVNILLVIRLKNSATTNSTPSCTNEGHEEDDSDHDEHLVGNPIYGGSQSTAGENKISGRENYDILQHNMGTGATGVNPIGAYEMISNLSTQPNKDIQTALQTIDASAVYAKLGADGIGANADENVRAGVKENELGSPYANIFEISPSNQ